MFLSSFYFKINFVKTSLMDTIRLSHYLDPNQDSHFVGPGLVPNCSQKPSADELGKMSIMSKQRRPG